MLCALRALWALWGAMGAMGAMGVMGAIGARRPPRDALGATLARCVSLRKVLRNTQRVSSQRVTERFLRALRSCARSVFGRAG